MGNQKWIKFEKGNLKNLVIYTTIEYSKNYVGGNADPEMMDDISSINKKNKVIFDVGAFTGVSSLIFSKLAGEEGKVIAFEPNEFNRKRIQKNYEKNKELAKKITVYPYALSNQNEQTKMIISSNIEGPSSTSRLPEAHSKIATTDLPFGFYETIVETKKLDDFVSETNIIPDVIKIDIEGAEHLMLLGSLEILKKYHPILYIEIHSEFCAIKCYDILNNYNYNIEVINEELDNRIMIKAVRSSKSKSENGKEYFESKLVFESVNHKIKEINEKINFIDELIIEKNKILNDLQITDEELRNLKEELNIQEKELSIKNEKLNSQEKEINSLRDELKNIYFSKSWKMTKPLRTLRIIFKRSDRI